MRRWTFLRTLLELHETSPKTTQSEDTARINRLLNFPQPLRVAFSIPGEDFVCLASPGVVHVRKVAGYIVLASK